LARAFGVRAAVAVGGVAALATAAGALWALRRRDVQAGVCEAPVCLPDDPEPDTVLGGPPAVAASPPAGPAMTTAEAPAPRTA
jgi:hypothetical protein